MLQHLHRIEVVRTDSPIVAHLAALRWSARGQRNARPPVAYLCRTATRGRLKVTSDRDAARVVGGPLPRAVARRVVAALALLPAEHVERFIEALAPGATCALDSSIAAHDLLSQVCARQRDLDQLGAAGRYAT